MELVDNNPAQAFIEAKNAADDARAKLVARLAEIKKERAEMHAKLTAEAKQIKALIGRGKAPKAAKAPRATKGTKAGAA